MYAVVLVGGFGTRLRPITYTTPKPLLPIAHVPMVERLVRQLGNGGVTHVVLALGFKPEPFYSAFPDNAKKYSRQAIETGGVDEDTTRQLEAELENYEAGRPCRERQELEDVPAAGDAGPEESRDLSAEPADPEAGEPRKPRRPFDD